MYNQTAPANGYGQATVGDPYIPNGAGGIHQSPPTPVPCNSPSGMVEQAAEMVASAIGEVRTATGSLSGLSARLFGENPEKTAGGENVSTATGRGNQLIANAQELHRAIGELHAEVKRLVTAL